MKIYLLDQIGSINNKYSISLCNSINGITHHSIVLITNSTNEFTDMKSFKNFKCLWDDYSIKKNPIQKLITYYKNYVKTYTDILENDIDVFHCQWFIFSPIDYYFIRKLKKHNKKVVVTVHDILPFNCKFYDRWFHSKIYKAANHVIAQANENYKLLQEEFAIKADKLSMIPHGHFMDFSEIIEKDIARNFLKLKHDAKIILFFGQIKKVKGLDILIKSFASIVDNFPDTYLMIAGKVWKDSFDEYKSIIDSYGINHHVICNIKYIPDSEIKYYFSATDIVALPYKKIYQSGVVQLAYAYEKAVIATNIGGFKDTIINGKTGVLIDSDNIASLTDGLINMLENPVCLNEYGKNGKEYLKKELSWEKIATDISAIYDVI